ncbi:flagellar biosynthesis protein FlhA [Anaeropeptidivorans aminofermentans]|uniref:flagellar biosynthesis protein FlhA n=1 Tax=Anaeropeptidivorans aminofermentans TaxID=2934315 RepID=UPI00225DEE2E|nr:flagellar biosynthesis protein FlhA [Anaeropeptidivorans aminofermentans]
MKPRDAIIGIAVISIIAIMMIPLPIEMMDFLLMINIGIALIVLLDALYSNDPLQMSFFPTILLIITIFRLALSISTTRLILGKGYAGKVVEAFGNFVAGNNLILGLIMFLILVIVNFLVITKGSERVSEVTARFTLDAMPGKQMAIDADLNTGLIDEDEARSRRKKIQDESNFYGAMDGASKFVKNDAIAGLIITFINLIGGIAMGVLGYASEDGARMSFGEAAQVFSLMTIGDGLVTQIPALCISTAMGLLVTKANTDEKISVALGRQLFGQPIALIIAGFVMIGFGIFTPMPTYLFIPFGIFLIICGYQMDRSNKIKSVSEEIIASDDEAEEIRRPENVVSLLNVDPILLAFGYGLIPLVDSSQGGDLLDRVVMIRRQIALELGAIVPIIRLRDDIKINPNEYRILIKGVEVAKGDILFDHYMAMNPGYVEEEIDGIETVEPYLGLPALWISESQRERAEAYGYTVVDAPAIIATHLTEVIRDNLHELISRQDVQTLIENVKESNPVLIDELVPKLMSVGDIQKVLANLLKESISIRDLVSILETLANYATVTRDIDLLTEYVRQALRRAISQKFFDSEMNTVITLDPELEQEIMSNIQTTEQGSYIALDPSMTQKIFDSLNSQVSKLASMGLQPIILTSPIVRTYFKRLIEQTMPELIVLSYNELEPNIDIQSIGMVSV